MSEMAMDHREAAGRHEMAAENHDRAANFWAKKGDAQRAALQHEMADHERHGAELERRWGELVQLEVVDRPKRSAQRAASHTQRGAKQLSATQWLQTHGKREG